MGNPADATNPPPAGQSLPLYLSGLFVFDTTLSYFRIHLDEVDNIVYGVGYRYDPIANRFWLDDSIPQTHRVAIWYNNGVPTLKFETDDDTLPPG